MNEQKDWRHASTGVWTGRVLSGLFVAFMLVVSVYPKFVAPHISIAEMERLGWPAKHLHLIGAIELIGTLLYLFPRSATLGAVLMTGLLGGAIAAQVRADSPLYTHMLFGLYLGLFMWGGLWLRDGRLRSILPLKSRD